MSEEGGGVIRIAILHGAIRFSDSVNHCFFGATPGRRSDANHPYKPQIQTSRKTQVGKKRSGTNALTALRVLGTAGTCPLFPAQQIPPVSASLDFACLVIGNISLIPDEYMTAPPAAPAKHFVMVAF